MVPQEANVVIVDDDPSVRQSLARLVRSAGLRPVTFSSAEEFLLVSPPEGPCCLVLDVRMPGLTGLELQSHLTASVCDMAIVFISGHGDIPTSVRAMKAGAVDFLPKPFQGEDLLAAIHKGLAEDGARKNARAEWEKLRARRERLTPRERQVMDLVAEGLANKNIAIHLGTTEKTVKVHRARVMAKMEAVSLADLVRMQERLLAGPEVQAAHPARPMGEEGVQPPLS